MGVGGFKGEEMISYGRLLVSCTYRAYSSIRSTETER